MNVYRPYDNPVCKVRGIKIYLPSENNIGYFKKLIDMAAYYRYNTVMIEIGGAMEYKKHPEINEGWIEYCSIMNEYSDKSKIIQNETFDWYKNSIHAENGGGGFLTQDRVAELADYCREKNMNVIPEVPSLSHSDYLLFRHPELAERIDDKYPDTYCPSNPETYNLLFDILGEVIEVFKPKIINIGHDEYYSIGICPGCRGKKAGRLFAEDIIKIYDFLKERKVKTAIWGDKLLNALQHGKTSCGGAEIEMYKGYDYDNGKYLGTIPATYTSIDSIPDDVNIIHWYWAIDRELEKEYLKRDFDVVYGNFYGFEFVDWKERILAGVNGGIISNWSALKEENLQRNGFLFNLVYSAVMFLTVNDEDLVHDKLIKLCLEELFMWRYGDLLKAKGDMKFQGTTVYLEITHSTDFRVEYREFTDGTFIDNSLYEIGNYVVIYEDGTRVRIPLIYGNNISNKDVSWERTIADGGQVYKIDRLLVEASSVTLPVLIDGMTYYKYIFENPYMDKKIKEIYFERNTKKECNIYIKNIKLVGGNEIEWTKVSQD